MINNLNPFQHEYTDPAGNNMLVAAMTAELLIKNLQHFLIDKPQFDLDIAKGEMLSDYADVDIDPRAAATLGLKLPTEAERQMAEESLGETKRLIHIEAIKQALPFMLIALTRDDTCEEAREIVQEFTGITGPIAYQRWNRHVIELLPAPMVVDDEEEAQFEGNL